MKPRNMTKKFFLALSLMLNAAGLFAQQSFKYRAALPKTDSDGFYQISLLPPLVARAQNNLADIRIVDGAGKFVPYIFGDRLPVKNQASFVAFPEVKPTSQPDSATVFIADNHDHQTISELYLKLRNSDVQRRVSLSGSDDLKNWYAIKENIGLTGADSNTSGTYEQQLNFPSSTYRYFKIQINHQNKQPVAILQAGIYRQQTVAPVYEQLPTPVLLQRDSAGSSYLTLRFAEAYQVNKLHLDFSGTKYYRRPVNIYQVNNGVRGLISETEISSSRLPDLYFSARSQILELQIINGDNPALDVKGVLTYQSEQSLVSYLSKGQQYYLLVGDEKAVSPQYDLQFFTDSLQRRLTSIHHGAVAANPQYQNKPAVAVTERTSPWLIWLAIAAVAAVLAFLTFKMVKEVNQRKEEEKG